MNGEGILILSIAIAPPSLASILFAWLFFPMYGVQGILWGTVTGLLVGMGIFIFLFMILWERAQSRGDYDWTG